MQFRIALPTDVPEVARVLSAAAAGLASRGQALWGAAEVSEAAVAPHVAAGLYHLGFDAQGLAGVFRLQLKDPAFWPEIPEGTSTYLHKLAVLPQRQGRGVAHALLGHAVELTRAQGLQFLRLDCVAGRPKLRHVYESFGFRHHSSKQIGSGAFERFEFDCGGAP